MIINRKKGDIMESKIKNDVWLLIQVILLFFVLIFAIITFFQSIFLVVAEILLALLMFVTAYNNHKIFKRKGITYVYLITGLFMLFLGIVTFF